MIERTIVEGRSAVVAYLKADWTPASHEDAELVKIVFDDGEVRFGVPVDPLAKYSPDRGAAKSQTAPDRDRQ